MTIFFPLNFDLLSHSSLGHTVFFRLFIPELEVCRLGTSYGYLYICIFSYRSLEVQLLAIPFYF